MCEKREKRRGVRKRRMFCSRGFDFCRCAEKISINFQGGKGGKQNRKTEGGTLERRESAESPLGRVKGVLASKKAAYGNGREPISPGGKREDLKAVGNHGEGGESRAKKRNEEGPEKKESLKSRETPSRQYKGESDVSGGGDRTHIAAGKCDAVRAGVTGGNTCGGEKDGLGNKKRGKTPKYKKRKGIQ